MIKTQTKAIAVTATQNELKECEEVIIKFCEEITQGNAEKALTLSIVLWELPKLRKGKSMSFNFGGKKEFKLSRIK